MLPSKFVEDLSDRHIERGMGEIMALKWFCAFTQKDETPNFIHFTKLYRRIGTKGISSLYNSFQEMLKEKGYMSEIFTMDTSSVISKTHLWKERDLAIQEGQETLNNQNVGKYGSDPDVSIVIPSCNGKDLLETVLQSIRRQSFQSYEVIVVDNGSTDGSKDFLQRKYPDVRVLFFSNRIGFSAAVNQGIAASRGRYIVLLNNDLELDPSWLYEMYSFLEQHDDAGFCASKMMNFYDRNIIDGAGDEFSTFGVPFRRGGGEKDNGQYDNQCYVFGACAGAAMYRRDLFDAIGLFDEDFFAYLEDVDISFRAQIAGYRCGYVPSAVAYHVGGASWSEASRSKMQLYLAHRNTIYVLVKSAPLGLLLRNFHKICYAVFGRFFSLAAHGYGLVYLKSIFDGLKAAPRFLRKRRLIMAKRSVSNKYLQKLMIDRYPRHRR